MSVRPNIQRMRRAMDRDRAHRLKREPEFRVSLRSLDLHGLDRVEAAARDWQARVRHHFPEAEFRIWHEPSRDEQVMRWF